MAPSSPTQLPSLPAPHAKLAAYLAEHSDIPITEVLEPYRVFEKQLRTVYAQERDHEALKDPYVNVLPLFTEKTAEIKIRARDLAKESQEEKDKYVMSLPDDKRKPHGAPAMVESIKQFQHNFNVFSESALGELNWDNVVAAGSSVVNCLLPVPKEFNKSKRALREYYHEKFCPASDVDLFLYGLTEEQALAKIQEIETRIKDSILTECTTVRTKHAITICSQYPTRHIQVVLRIYKSVSEILTGFDIDCSGAAYDGTQVYCTPRALQSYMTQINHIDLSRRSPSYENRLSKYSHRNFEVYWRELDRSRIDPTIFERSFRRTLGLARLLVLERLPTTTARDAYLAKRREERGRPAIHRDFWSGGLRGNIKDRHEDEIADWVNEEEVSNYHTFTIPYGHKFHAKKIEKLCYTRDLLLNAEWNQPKEREVYLHRHPVFFGRFADVSEDCCGFCPKPQTEEELKVAEEEGKIYVSGKVTFIKDDPGRQQIGSFNPLTEDDWTEMAYVGNTARLCQAIVDGDAEHVEDWLAQEGADPNKRDYTGRTPLHLAVTSSTPQVVRLLVEKGARLVARLADGRTALHLAAERGDVEIVKILMDKSTENEAAEEEKKDRRRAAVAAGASAETETPTAAATAAKPPSGEKKVQSAGESEDGSEDEESDEDDSDGELVDEEGSEDDDGGHSMATGSFVKVKKGKEEKNSHEDVIPDEKEDDPDFYNVNVVAWDTPCSALHLAIVSGHDDVVKLLCQEYGADVLLPVKFLGRDSKPTAALLALALTLTLPVDKAKSMTETLLSLGATSAQGDLHGFTAFHRYVEGGASELLETLWELDQTGAKTAINHLASVEGNKLCAPLQSAIINNDARLVLKLLDAGAIPEIDFETWLKSAKQTMEHRLSDLENNTRIFRESTEQPLILALQSHDPSCALEILEHSKDDKLDVNIMAAQSYNIVRQGGWWSSYYRGQTALDIVRKQLGILRKYDGEKTAVAKPSLPRGMDEFLARLTPDSWEHGMVAKDIRWKRQAYEADVKKYEKVLLNIKKLNGVTEKKREIKRCIGVLEKCEAIILERGGKIFDELHPDRKYTGAQTDNGNTSKAEDKDEGYEFQHSFSAKDVTKTRLPAYTELFEAAWSGNLERIKELTLASWDEEKTQSPLTIATTDKMGHNLFQTAYLRGHYDAARAILEIAQAQYAPEEPSGTTRFVMSRPNEEDSDESDECSDEGSDSDGDEPQIYPHIVDTKFTIDNIGEVSMQVKSRTKPLHLIQAMAYSRMPSGAVADPDDLQSQNLFGYAIKRNDLKGVQFLLDVATHHSGQKLDGDEDEPSRFYSFPNVEFTRAVEMGRIEILAEIIRRTGAGLPLEDLIKKSGVELKEKPRFYQGLTVYGKKRKDWAAAGRRVVSRTTGTQTAPLLIAAGAGCIESVEWFLSDAPLRHYLDFAKTKAAREDVRLKHLSSAPGGFDKAITRWLGNQNDLVMHAAIVGCPTGGHKGTRLVEYLIKAYELSMSARAQPGWTPLHLACLMGRTDIVRLLLPHSDQTAKDGTWNTTLHLILSNLPRAAQLREMLDLFDRDLVEHMFRERNSLAKSGGRSPLHEWLSKAVGTGNHYNTYGSHEEVAEVLRLLIDYSGGNRDKAKGTELLSMLDGAGETPLHRLVSKQAHPDLIRVLLDFDPSLLHREGAVGRTPAEVAADQYMASRVTAPRSCWAVNAEAMSEIAAASPDRFLGPSGRYEKPQSVERYYNYATNSWAEKNPVRKREIYDLCAEYAARHPGKRRLVSLNEANDVARRLGETYQTDRYYRGTRPRGDEGSEEGAGDADADEDEDEDEDADEAGSKKKTNGEDGARPDDIVSSQMLPISSRAWKPFGEECAKCGASVDKYPHVCEKDREEE